MEIVSLTIFGRIFAFEPGNIPDADALWDLQDLTSKEELSTFSLQKMQDGAISAEWRFQPMFVCTGHELCRVSVSGIASGRICVL